VPGKLLSPFTIWHHDSATIPVALPYVLVLCLVLLLIAVEARAPCVLPSTNSFVLPQDNATNAILMPWMRF
jgi:hypothetical protein